jgi:hypothetical protein
MLVCLSIGVDFKGPKGGAQLGRAIPDWPTKQVGQGVGGIGGDQQTPPTARRGHQGKRRRRGRLADAALAADE